MGWGSGGGGASGQGGRRIGGQGGCIRRSEIFVKIQKTNLGGGVGQGGGGRSGIAGIGVGEGGSKVWGRWVMWGIGDVSQE